ncbi:hypothetical protein [Aliikangiella coralliicola]|uniref:Uncharacterized protein n=1 Tax=Aliikangiella coralliicola TaxID=2592383 RepID=A0A545UCU3_9GAMM|nr:hypothetical protein [Aliikangiella coralliicola]TQV87285.1 hypothetical protein FLL46_12605 [Aliikangiella coralliicola]
MMRAKYNRKTSPKVIGGLVQRKNNHVKTARLGYVVDRVRPAKGFTHVLTKKDIHDFVEIIPDWCEISVGIESIILDSGNDDFDGLYEHFNREGTGIIWLSAWRREMWVELNKSYFQAHHHYFKCIGVVCEEKEESWLCYFTQAQAKAFMLMHVFLHELGHHVDRLRSKNQKVMNGGEEFAEKYAKRRFDELWPRYVEQFGLVR